MPKYLIKASYSPQGIKGVMKDGGTARADAIGKMVASMGGSLENSEKARTRRSSDSISLTTICTAWSMKTRSVGGCLACISSTVSRMGVSEFLSS